MIRLTKLFVNNFMSIGSITLDVRDGVFLVEGYNQDEEGVNSNGTGKTSLFESVAWCLYGHTVRGISKDDVIRRKSSGTHVCVGLIVQDKDASLYMEVHRYRKHEEYGDGVRIFIDGAEHTLKSIKLNDARIVEILGIEFDTLLDSVYITQGFSNRFSVLSFIDRLACIERIVDMRIYEAAAKHARQRVRSRTQLVNTDEGKLSQIMSGLQDLQELEQSVNRQIETVGDKKDTDLTELQERLDKIDLSIIGETIQEESTQLEKLQQQKEELQEKKMPKISRRDVLTSEIERFREELSKVKSLDMCPTCKQKVPKEVRVKLVSDIKGELSVREEEIEKIINELERMKTESGKIVASLGIKQTALDNARREKDQKQADRAKLERTVAEVSGVVDTVKKLQEQLDEIGEKAKRLGREYLALQEKIKENTTLLEYEDFWTTGFQHLRRRVMHSLISYINQRIEQYSKFLWDRNVRLVLNDNNILVEVDGHDIRTCSGGESKRVDLSIAFALRDLVSASVSPCSWLVVDEPFDFLDDRGAKGLVELLGHMPNVTTTFIVTHDSSLKGFIPETLALEKRNGITSLLD